MTFRSFFTYSSSLALLSIFTITASTANAGLNPLRSSTSALMTPVPTYPVAIHFTQQFPFNEYTEERPNTSFFMHSTPIKQQNLSSNRAASTPPENTHCNEWLSTVKTSKSIDRVTSHAAPTTHVGEDDTNMREQLKAPPLQHSRSKSSDDRISNLDVSEEMKGYLRGLRDALTPWSGSNGFSRTQRPPSPEINTTLDHSTSDFEESAIRITVHKSYAERNPNAVLSFDHYLTAATGEYYSKAPRPNHVDIFVGTLDFMHGDTHVFRFGPTMTYNIFDLYQIEGNTKSVVFRDLTFV